MILIVCRVNDAQSRPRQEYTPKPKPAFDFGEVEHSNGGCSSSASSPPAYSSGTLLSFCFFPSSYCVCACVRASHSYDWCVFPSATLSKHSTVSRAILPKTVHQEQTAWVDRGRKCVTCTELKTITTTTTQPVAHLCSRKVYALVWSVSLALLHCDWWVN